MAVGSPITKLPITLQLSEKSRRQLAERAARSGRDIADYASELIERAVNAPTLDEILAPIRAEVAHGGMSEKELMDFGRGELEALRREKRGESS